MKWDISGIGTWADDDFPKGARIPEAGNSNDYATGGWRSDRPERDTEKCTQCLLCWVYCPDTAVRVEAEKVVEFDLEHCKGCGICAQVCAPNAIEMVPEGCELIVEAK